MRSKTETDCIVELLTEAVEDGWITCPECGNHIEPDGEKCCCGWKNPIFGDFI